MLIQQLAVAKKNQDHFLLDGHYCLIDSHNQICPIGIKIFRQMNPSYLLLLKDSVANIASRLTKRDATEWNEGFVEQFQDIEENHAKKISYELDIPLQIFYNGEIE